MEQDSWPKLAAKKLYEWIELTSYSPQKRLAEELGISPSNWAHLLRGNNIIESDNSIYARLYYKTQIAELHPCTIPPKIYKSPYGAESSRVRAWSQERWEAWLKGYEDGLDAANRNTLMPLPQENNLATDLDGLLDQLYEELAWLAEADDDTIEKTLGDSRRKIGKLYSVLSILSQKSEDRSQSQRMRRNMQ